VLEACALALLKRRGDSIAEAADAFDSTEAQRLIERIETLSLLLEQFIVAHKLLEDRRVTSRVSLIVPAWQAASRVRPQPTMQGQVVELVKGLRAALNDDGAIPMPSWVTTNQEGDVESSSAGDDVPIVSEDES
jgi:hypothetical protein